MARDCAGIEKRLEPRTALGICRDCAQREPELVGERLHWLREREEMLEREAEAAVRKRHRAELEACRVGYDLADVDDDATDPNY